MSDNKVIRTTVLATRSYILNDTKFVVQTADGTKKASWNTLMHTLTSTLPHYSVAPTPPPTTPSGTVITTPPPTTPAGPTTTPPPTTAVNYGFILLNPNSGESTVGTPITFTLFGNTGSFPSGTAELYIANETTGGGYSLMLSQSVSGSFSLNPVWTPSIPGNYSFQMRIIVSGHTGITFTPTGGWAIT